MSNIFYSTADSNIIVKSNPTITFDNGMVLWLAKEGETFELSSYDWAKIQQINAMVRSLGIFKDRYLTQEEIKKEEEKEKNSISYKIRKALEKWAKLIRLS